MRYLGAAVTIVVAAACSGAEPGGARRYPPPVFAADAQDYAAHVERLKARLAAQGLGHLHVRVEEPFVVIGDGTQLDVERSAGTVRWAADRLEADFFRRRPAKIVDIYLFRNERSYERGVKTLTGESPSTPYGFYSPAQGAMFMNIATGGGTLVHEIVHPYVEADFPDAPAWLNEGLGSLFEQSDERDGHIVGLPNWRLPGLQRTIRRADVPSFRALTALSRDEFYGDKTGTNYAQARYLMYYLQERGLLRDYYRAFRATAKDDPTGYELLGKILRERDMARFQRHWERYVLGLVFE